MESGIFDDITNCSLCLELYNEVSRCPRVLICGHTLCHSCLENILTKSSCCPTCLIGVQHEKAEQVPINFAIRNMIPSVKQELENASNSLIIPFSNRGKLESEGFCFEHSNFKELRCMDCACWICGICCSLNHKLCRTLLVKEAYQEMKIDFLMRADNGLKTMNAINGSITNALVHMYKRRKDFNDDKYKRRKDFNDDMYKRRKDFNDEWEKDAEEKRINELESLQSDGLKFCEELRDLKVSNENATEDKRFSKAVDQLNELLNRGKKLAALLDALEIVMPYTMESLKHLCERQYVYVVEEQARPLYGMVNVHGNQIWISSFRTEKPNARLLPFKAFLTRFNGSSDLPKRAFLKLLNKRVGGKKEQEIELVIETDGQSPRALNFILLCSALKGQKYKGRVLQCYNGTSSCKLNRGPPPVVKDISFSDPQVPWVEGCVTGMTENNSWFNIALKGNFISFNYYAKIGVVVSGLQKLQEFTGRRLTIKDCGMIIRLP